MLHLLHVLSVHAPGPDQSHEVEEVDEAQRDQHGVVVGDLGAEVLEDGVEVDLVWSHEHAGPEGGQVRAQANRDGRRRGFRDLSVSRSTQRGVSALI